MRSYTVVLRSCVAASASTSAARRDHGERGAGVGRVRHPADELVVLEPIDEVGHRRRRDAQRLADPAQRQRRLRVDRQPGEHLVAGERQVVLAHHRGDLVAQQLLRAQDRGEHRHPRRGLGRSSAPASTRRDASTTSNGAGSNAMARRGYWPAPSARRSADRTIDRPMMPAASSRFDLVGGRGRGRAGARRCARRAAARGGGGTGRARARTGSAACCGATVPMTGWSTLLEEAAVLQLLAASACSCGCITLPTGTPAPQRRVDDLVGRARSRHHADRCSSIASCARAPAGRGRQRRVHRPRRVAERVAQRQPLLVGRRRRSRPTRRRAPASSASAAR